MKKMRHATFPVHEAFTDRWSTVAFKTEAIDRNVLMSCFEAARWAPSSYNSQPWRFIYALNYENNPSWAHMMATMHPLNQAWATHASALVLCLVRKAWIPPKMSSQVDLPWNDFDLGAACMSFSLQASMLGWHTHAVGGFDKDLARKTLKIPDAYKPMLMMVVGKHDPERHNLPPDLYRRDQMTQRIPLDELVFEDTYKGD